jgi:hypothetical protein
MSCASNSDICFRKYSWAEQEEILKYVVRHDAYGLLKGTSFWKMMEENMVKETIINVGRKDKHNPTRTFLLFFLLLP